MDNSNELKSLNAKAADSAQLAIATEECKSRIFSVDEKLKELVQRNPHAVESFLKIKLRTNYQTGEILRNKDGKLSGYESPWYVPSFLLGNVEDPDLERLIDSKKTAGLKNCNKQR